MDLPCSFRQSPLLIPKDTPCLDRVTSEEHRTERTILGMGTLIDGHPALADAMNESGLACAGLNFARYACYADAPAAGKRNLAPYDLILQVLSLCDTTDQAADLLSQCELVAVPINRDTPLPTLHWMIADKTGKSIVAERTRQGLSIHHNPVGVMTNDPTFDWHLTNLNEYLDLHPEHPRPVHWSEQPLRGLGIGSGTLGMPGDFSSVSRFVRAAYARAHLPGQKDPPNALAQFFHILDNCAMVKGCVYTKDGQEDLTLYSSCMDLTAGVYYYRTYANSRITAIPLDRGAQNGIKTYPYADEQDICWQN